MFCKECVEWQGGSMPFGKCNYFNNDVPCNSCCPHGSKSIEDAISNAVEDAISNAVEQSNNIAIPKVVDTKKKVSRRKTAEPKVVLRNPATPVMQLYKHQLEAFEKFKDAENIALFFEMGVGKGQPLTSKVLTPTGFKELGSLAIGDLVISPIDGNSYPITGIFNKGKRHINKVTFTNGTFTLCDDEHLWNIQDNNERLKHKPFRTVDMSYLKSKACYLDHGRGKEHKMFIPINTTIHFTDDHFDNAYMIGVLIGDGCLGHNTISVCLPEKDCYERFKAEAEQFGYELHQVNDISYNINKASALVPLKDIIVGLNLNVKSEFKHIPDCYLYADVATRKAILEGLMNSDGFVKNGRCYYNSVSSKLIDDIIFLVSSLGGVCNRLKDKDSYYYKDDKRVDCLTSYNVSFMLDGLNLSEKHTAKYKGHRTVFKSIDSIEDAGFDECACIYINSPDHLYITDDWIVTHNTITSLKIAEYKYKTGQIKNMLVIAPNDVHKQWYDDLVNGVMIDGVLHSELDIDFEAQCLGGRGGQAELYPFERDDIFHFVSVNVDTFSTPHKWEQVTFWANLESTMIVIDEATVIKNPDSKRSIRLLYEFNDNQFRGKSKFPIVTRKKFPYRAVLTGTPVTNGPIDLWAIMEFVQPNYFGRNYYSFRNYYGMFTTLSVEYVTPSGKVASREVQILLTEKVWQGIHDCQSYEMAHILFGCSEDTYMTVKHQSKFLGPYKHADELKQLLEPVAIFKKLTDCVSMPPVNYIIRHIGMSTEQQGVYNSMRKELLATYAGHETVAKNRMIVSIRLQQISSGFIMGHKTLEQTLDDILNAEDITTFDNMDINPDEVIWIGDNIPKLDALMRDVAECDKPLLILTRYSAEAAKIYELCDKAGYKTGLFTGWKIIGGVEAFKSGELDILVANSTKIARGFNLQIAHTTLFYSNTFSMETRQQAEFRTFRMGQKKPCLYIDYSCSEIDDTVFDALRMKKNLLEYIREKPIETVI